MPRILLDELKTLWQHQILLEQLGMSQKGITNEEYQTRDMIHQLQLGIYEKYHKGDNKWKISCKQYVKIAYSIKSESTVMISGIT